MKACVRAKREILQRWIEIVQAIVVEKRGVKDY